MKPKSEIEAITLDEFCMVCGRVLWGDYQPLGYGIWRHEECYAGSEPWMDMQRRLPEKRRSFLFKFYDENKKV